MGMCRGDVPMYLGVNRSDVLVHLPEVPMGFDADCPDATMGPGQVTADLAVNALRVHAAACFLFRCHAVFLCLKN